MNHHLASLLNYTHNLSVSEKQHINAQVKEHHVFYALYGINKYLFDLTKKINRSNYPNISDCVEKIIESMTEACCKKLKKSLHKSLSHEFNVLLKNNFIKDDFSAFLANTCNDPEWIVYYFDKYPVLLSLLEKTIQYSVDYIKEFLNNFNQDIDKIEKIFDIQLKSFSSIHVFTQGTHNNHKNVLRLNFNNHYIFYKPRTLKNEESVYNLFTWLETNGLKKSILIPRILSKDNYGWIEGIDYQEVKTELQLKDFYLNQGINLAIFYVLGANDLTAYNIIAHGELPCYFDLECILTPSFKGCNHFSIYEHDSEAAQFIQNSVLKSYLLPKQASMTISKAQPKFSIAGLSVVNTGDCNNIPAFSSIKYKTSDFLEFVIQGFELTYDFIEHHKIEITDYLSCYFKKHQIRLLYRSGTVYSTFLTQSLLPKYLTSFEKRAELFNTLHKGDLNFMNAKRNQLINAEISALENFDIPLFYTFSDSTDIYAANGQLIADNFFKKSGLFTALSRVSELNSADKKRQLELIEMSFYIHEHYARTKSFYSGKDIQFTTENQPFNNTEIKNEILAIYHKILSQAFNANGRYSYYNLTVTSSGVWNISAQNFGLFQGLDGLAFFYLNFYKLFQQQQALEMGLSFLETGLNQFNQYTDFYAHSLSHKTSLFKYPVSTFYVAEYYLQQGIKVDFLTNDLINKFLQWIENFYSADKEYDLANGGAGTLIYLLKLYHRLQDKKVLLLCEKIADYLIAQGNVIDDRQLCWISKTGKAFTGLCYGSSGIALSLFKLDDYSGQTKYTNYAQQALNFARNLFDKENNCWYSACLIAENEMINTENHGFDYGSAGIALSRMLIAKYYQDDLLNDEIETGIANIVEKEWPKHFNYSSGVFGCVDVLNEYSFFKNDARFKEKLDSFVSKLVKDKHAYQGWGCARIGNNDDANLEINGFFTGIAGIANTLINLVEPETQNLAKLFR